MKSENNDRSDLPQRPHDPCSTQSAADALAEIWALGGFDIEPASDIAPDTLIVDLD